MGPDRCQPAPTWHDPDPPRAWMPPVDEPLGTGAGPTPDRYRWMVESVSEIIFEADPAGRWTYLNPAWTRTLGFPIGESLGRPFLDYVHPDDRAPNLEKFLAVVNGPADSCRFEARYLTADGGVRHMEIHAWIFRGPNREPLGSTGTLTDVTALAARERRFRALVQSASDAVAVCDPAGTVTWASPGYARLAAIPEDETVGSSLLDRIAPEWRASTREALQRAGRTLAAARPVEVEFVRPEGGRRHVEMILTGMVSDPAVGGIVVNARDISERKAFELELERRATHDDLTGLPNRALLAERVTRAVQGSAGRPSAVIFLDLDQFKLVNDTLGHDAGDQVLRTVAGR
ncbi:MAG TPA: PAS domain S-box protein, partial [Acidimicrobiia bacterium]|nr:PAS domain S-box protein [Acidimicrobiia bacterium]